MRKMSFLALVIITVFSCSPISDTQDGGENEIPSVENGSGEEGGYVLVWEDLFNDDVLDEKAWNIEVNGDGGGNAELQYYRRENVALGQDKESGRKCLILTARKESFNGKSFTSGRVNTMKKKFFRYGKIEASIKVPATANGLWPAFWLMGNNYPEVGWPRCGEIDILEMGNSTGIRNHTQDRYFNGACHWGFYKDLGNGNWAYPNYAKASTWSYSLQDGDFHLFTIIWDEQRVRMYVDMDKYPDESPYFEMDITGKDDDWGVGHYFHHDYFILFNLAVGGHFTGMTNPAQITAFPESGEVSMYVDFVKVYQMK